MRSAVLTIVGALVQTVVREEVGADAGLASSLYDRSPSVCWIEDGMHIYYTEDADGKRALTTAADPAGTVAAGGVFIRRVYATSNCGPCQVQNLGDHSSVGKIHIANVFTPVTRVKVGSGPAKFEVLEEGEAATGQTKYCSCKVPVVGDKKGRMKTALMFMGVDNGRNSCDQLNCYEKYVYFAERYVLNQKPASTDLYHLAKKVVGADSSPDAWARMCCEADTGGCTVTSEGAKFKMGDSEAVAPGTYITSSGELRQKYGTIDLGDGEEQDTDIIEFEWRCAEAFCQVDGVAFGGLECKMIQGTREEQADEEECRENMPEPPACPMDPRTPDCSIQRSGGRLIACAGGNCQAGKAILDQLTEMMQLCGEGDEDL